MKQCPTCKTTYTDVTLRFCLADGAVLTEVGEEQETFVRTGGAEKTAILSGGGTNQMRVEIPQDAPPSHFTPVSHTGAQPPSGSSILKIILIIVALFFLVLILLGVGGGVFYYSMGGKEPAANNATPSPNKQASPTPSSSPTPSASPSPTSDDMEDLKEQIANLEKKLNEQNKNRPANAPATQTGTPARVYSPGDGFLALRNYPSSEVGSRVVAIPHGANISVAGCLGTSRVGNKSGRWCRANYNGYSGWVFDAWLQY